MIKVVTYRQETQERSAYCRDCDWISLGINANSSARYHCKKRGHKIDVYTTYRSVVKQI